MPRGGYTHVVQATQKLKMNGSVIHRTIEDYQATRLPTRLAEILSDPRFQADHPVPSEKLTKLSVVIPVYNEEATVQALVSLVVNAPIPGGLRREIILHQRLLERRHGPEAG